MPTVKTPAKPAAAKPRRAPAAAKPDTPVADAATVDAILRDPKCPDSVKQTVAALHAVTEYVDSVDFTDTDGYVTVKHHAVARGDTESDA